MPLMPEMISEMVRKSVAARSEMAADARVARKLPVTMEAAPTNSSQGASERRIVFRAFFLAKAGSMAMMTAITEMIHQRGLCRNSMLRYEQ